MSIEVKILGPIEATAGGVQVPLGDRRQRLLFGILAHELQVVEKGRLIRCLWDQVEIPRDPEDQIHGYVKGLRAALRNVTPPGEQLIRTERGAGYELTLSPAKVDRHRFAQFKARAEAAERKDPGTAARLGRCALREWTNPVGVLGGAPLVDSRLEVFTRSLQQDHRSVVLLCLRAELACGRHNQLLSELTRLSTDEYGAEDPDLTRLHMIALFRAGRPHEALSVYQRHAAALDEILGVEPNEELKALKFEVARGDEKLKLAEQDYAEYNEDETPPETGVPQPRSRVEPTLSPAGRAVRTSEPNGAAAAYFSRIADSNPVAVYPIQRGEEWTIGRDSEDCTVVVPDQFRAVGRKHARFGCDEAGACWVVGIHENGTYVNDVKVGDQQHTVRAGDVISLAGTRRSSQPICSYMVTTAPMRTRVPSTDYVLSENATILAMRATPAVEPILLEAEFGSIDRAIQSARFRDQLDLRQATVRTLSDLHLSVHRYAPAIIHFCGDSTGSARGVALLNGSGHVEPIPADSLARFFRLMSPPVRCVVLSGCLSREQGVAIAEFVDCVVGSPPEVSEEASKLFFGAFYTALASGDSVQRSHAIGCAVSEEAQRQHDGSTRKSFLLVGRGNGARKLHVTADRGRRS